MSLLFLFGTPVASPGHVIAGVRSNYVSCSFGLVGYGPISMQAPMCQWLITCVLRCANELNQLLMKELSISRLGQRWCSLPSTSHPHPLHPVSLSYLDLRCLTSSPRSCFILVGDCYVEQKTYILTFIFCHFFIIMNGFPSFTHLLCRLDLICCSLPSSLPLRVRTRIWSWLT